jgi:hypothetical protein
VVDVPDRADVDVRLASVEFLFAHRFLLSVDAARLNP